MNVTQHTVNINDVWIAVDRENGWFKDSTYLLLVIHLIWCSWRCFSVKCIYPLLISSSWHVLCTIDWEPAQSTNVSLGPDKSTGVTVNLINQLVSLGIWSINWCHCESDQWTSVIGNLINQLVTVNLTNQLVSLWIWSINWCHWESEKSTCVTENLINQLLSLWIRSINLCHCESDQSTGVTENLTNQLVSLEI